MIAELIFSYYFMSNDPILIRKDSGPYKQIEIALNVKSDITKRLSLMVEPYVARLA